MAELRNAANQREPLVPAVIMPHHPREPPPSPHNVLLLGIAPSLMLVMVRVMFLLFFVVHATVCYRTLMLVVMVVEVMLMSLRVA